MCQSKADGGRRCAFHLEQSAGTAVASFATETSPLSRQGVDDTLVDLEREGANLPAPGREEVDAWLEGAVAAAAFEPNLSESRRESIVRRLRAAIGHITPSGATFHAWKNVVAEAWSRSKRRAGAFFVVGALSFGLGGCATAPAADTTPTNTSPVATAPATPASFKAPTIAPLGAVQGDAAAAYGEKNVQACYNDAAEYLLDNQARGDLMAKDPAALTDADFAGPKSMMTKTAAADWDANVANRNDPQAAANLKALAMFSIDKNSPSKFRLRPDVPDVVVNKKVSPTGVAVENDRLRIDVDYSAEIRSELKDGTSPVRNPFTASTSFWFKVTDSGKCKIDGWQTTWRDFAPIADSK